MYTIGAITMVPRNTKKKVVCPQSGTAVPKGLSGIACCVPSASRTYRSSTDHFMYLDLSGQIHSSSI